MAENTAASPEQGDLLLRIDMTNQTLTTEPYPEKWRLLGGRALSARVLLEECDPKCDPLGPDNVLVFAPGVLAGTAAPTSGRLSVGAKSPLTGGEVRPFHLTFDGREYRPRELHALFYGRAHLTFGWSRQQQDLTLPWQHLSEYCSAVAEDALALFGPGERPLAYVLGWMTHLVGDGLIKSVWPGVTLDLLDGKYTPRNRPIQDLYTYHEVGRKDLQINWPALRNTKGKSSLR